MDNYGIQNEMDIIEILNNKKMGKLPPFWRSFVASLFPNESLNDVVLCNKAGSNKKEDIILVVNHNMVTVSIKSGNNVSVHTESLNRFCGFLKWLGISDENINILRLYHYGDGTIDGTGEVRIGAYDLMKKYKDEIKKFNSEINNSEKMFRIILRLIKLGTPNQNGCADYIYYGDSNKGIYCDTYRLASYLSKKDYSYIEGIHFGPFIYNNRSRNIYHKNTDEDSEKELKRHYCNIKWPSIEEDILDFKANRYKKRENQK